MADMSGFIKSKKWVQFFQFALVGLLNTFISEFIYIVLVYWNVHYLLASFIGFSVSVVNAFYWNHKYVFAAPRKGKEHLGKIFVKTYVAYLGSYLLSAFLLVLWIDIISIARWMRPLARWFAAHHWERLDQEFLGKALAAFFNILLTVPINFLANKYWAFGEKKKHSSST